ncbi:MAG: protoporphyrinogen oxidase [Pirellulales bacterium]|nr:protoporphyrinogen oxidase [Pirellulales bacterium]
MNSTQSDDRSPPSSAARRSHRVAIVGAGISGLAAAHRLRELDPRVEVAVFEAGSRAGGAIATVANDGFLAELGPDNFISQPATAIELCSRLGLAEQLIAVEPSARSAYVVSRGKLVRLPEGFALMAPRRVSSFLASPLLSWPGKLRVLAEPLVPTRTDDADESLADFARRRLGREAFERIVQPLVAGIYTADPEKLSMRAALRRFFDFERRDGGLLRSLSRETQAIVPGGDHAASPGQQSGPRYNLFVTPRDGMQVLITALLERLPADALRFNSPVTSVSPLAQTDNADATATGWRVTWRRATDPQELVENFDELMLALPAPRCAELVANFATDLSAELRNIDYAGAAVIVAGYERSQVSHPLDASGFVVPAIERHPILACSFSSSKYAGRAATGKVLLRVFVGGACDPQAGELPDTELHTIVAAQLGELIGLRGTPCFWHVARWPASMPQYYVGHCDRVARIESLAERWPSLTLAGNAYHGVGIPACIASGEAAAERVLKRRAPCSERGRDVNVDVIGQVS